MGKRLVVLYGCSEGLGLTYHLADMAEALAAELTPYPEVELHLVSTPGEQEAGLWERLSGCIGSSRLHRFDDLAGVVPFVKGLLASADTDKVVVLTQGVRQLMSLVPLKRAFGDRLRLAIRLNAFRNGKWYSPLYTFGLSFALTKYCDYVDFQCDGGADIFTNARRIFNAGIGGMIPLGCAQAPLLTPEHQELREVFENDSLRKFVYLAQLYPAKNHLWLIDSLRDLLRKHDGMRLVLLGDGQMLERIESRARSHGIENKVLCFGRVPRAWIPWLLTRADCAIVASKTETFGHCYLEPMFFGTPVIGTDRGIAKEIIKDFHTGFLIKNFSQKQLVRAVDYFLAHPEACSAYGENAAKLVGVAFGWASVARRLADLVRSL